MELKKKVRAYAASWKHPETRQWIKLSNTLVAKKEWLVDSLEIDAESFSGINTEFKRNARFAWKVNYVGFETVTVTIGVQNQYPTILIDGVDYSYDELGDVYYHHIIEDIFGLEWDQENNCYNVNKD